MFRRYLPPAASEVAARPLIGVLCCNETHDRAVQVVASRFVRPLASYSKADVVLVPALADAMDIRSLARRLDGLLLTGARSDVAPHHYGGGATAEWSVQDEQRDEVALSLSAALIEKGRPVFGICRGLQELNVLFGGTLTSDIGDAHHHPDGGVPYEHLFEHGHEVALTGGGMLAAATGEAKLSVNSVHRQGILRLGTGLDVEAVARGDGLIEAFSSRPCGAPVLAVQWHPEWSVRSCGPSRALFARIGSALDEARRLN